MTPLRTLLVLSTLAWAGHAGAEIIDQAKPPARFALLKEGSHHYLRYIREGDSNTPLDIWVREVHFEARGLHIKQRWDAVGKTPSIKWLDSWFDAGSFKPQTHVRITEKEGKRVVEGFVFSADKISGMKDLADNTQKDLLVASPQPAFNFETDIEFLQTLPLASGYEAQINFYHPGGATPPALYTFKVAGEATIAGPSGPVDCWRVTTDYNRPGTISTFWIAKATQQLLRQEGDMGGGKTLIKTLID